MPRRGLFQRGKIWWIGYYDIHGRYIRESTRTDVRKAAEIVYASKEIDSARSDAGIPVTERIHVGRAGTLYLAHHERTWSPGWFATSRPVIHSFVAFVGPDKPVAKVTRDDATAWRDALLDPARAYTNATVNRYSAVVAKFGAWCVERRYLTQNTWGGFKQLREATKPIPNVEELPLNRFLEALPPDVRPIVTFMVDTGWRRSQLSRLKWVDVDLRRGTAKVWKTKNGDEVLAFFTPRVAEMLRDLARRPDGFVFGKVPDFRKSMKTAARKAGFPHLWQHVMRHWWATRAVRAGATLPELMALGAWKTTRMPMRYAHADAKGLRDLTSRIGGHSMGTGTSDEAAHNQKPE